MPLCASETFRGFLGLIDLPLQLDHIRTDTVRRFTDLLHLFGFIGKRAERLAKVFRLAFERGELRTRGCECFLEVTAEQCVDSELGVELLRFWHLFLLLESVEVLATTKVMQGAACA